MVALGLLYILFAGGLAFIVLASVITYIVSKFIFDKHSNRALTDNETGKRKKMLRPIAVTGIVAGSILILFIALGAVFMALGAVFTDSGNIVLGDWKTPSAELYFMEAGSSLEPDKERYELVSVNTEESIECYVYARKSDDLSEIAPYVIVSIYKGEKEIASAEAMLSNKDSASGTLTYIDGSLLVYESSLFDVEYPGTLRISFREKSGGEVALIFLELN